MLFIESDSKKTIETLEDLRKLGFHVVCDGIDYTYQETPFTFMHELLAEVLERRNWHGEKLATTCMYCNKEARGTELRIDGNLVAADDPEVFRAGDRGSKLAYGPVCCDEHKSCSNQPSNFVRKELPALSVLE